MKKNILTLLILFLVSCGKSTGVAPDSDSGSEGASDSYKVIFVTTWTGSANLGGVSGADAKCNADTNKPSSGTFKAFLVDEAGDRTTTVDWVLSADTTYARKDGTVIGTTNSSSKFDFPLTNSFSDDYDSYWTGLDVNWNVNPSGSCSSWTSSSSALGTFGNGKVTSSAAIGLTANSGGTTFGTPCSYGGMQILCVEQ